MNPIVSATAEKYELLVQTWTLIFSSSLCSRSLMERRAIHVNPKETRLISNPRA